jgi:hypothetical protein
MVRKWQKSQDRGTGELGTRLQGTGQPGENSWNRTNRTRWSEHGSKVRTAGTGKLWTRMQGEESRDRKGGEDSLDRITIICTTPWAGQLGKDNQG